MDADNKMTPPPPPPEGDRPSIELPGSKVAAIAGLVEALSIGLVVGLLTWLMVS